MKTLSLFTFVEFFILCLAASLLCPSGIYVHAELQFFYVQPAPPRRLHSYPFRSNFDFNRRQNLPVSSKQPRQSDPVFQIEPFDAISEEKYSQPDLTYSRVNSNLRTKVPFPNSNPQQTQEASIASLGNYPFSNLDQPNENPSKPPRNIRFLDASLEDIYTDTVKDDKLNNKVKHIPENLEIADLERNLSSLHSLMADNLNNSSNSLVSVSSETILSYETPPIDFNKNLPNISVKQNSEVFNNVPNPIILDVNPTDSSAITEIVYTTEPSVFDSPVYIDYFNQTNSKDNLSISDYPAIFDDGNITNSLQSSNFGKKMSSGAVAGIVIAVLISVTLVSSAVIYLLYRKFNGKCTGVVDSKFNTDSCGYLDDSLRSSIYLNNHIELPKESSEEMTSLDNDSFLNSLETMTIQNYWADNSKNTKV